MVGIVPSSPSSPTKAASSGLFSLQVFPNQQRVSMTDEDLTDMGHAGIKKTPQYVDI